MTASDPIDAARLNLLLGELRLSAIKHIWSAFTERADKEGWQRRDCSLPSPNTRLPNADEGGLNVISPKHACRGNPPILNGVRS